MDEEDAALLGLLDGSRTVGELLARPRSLVGPAGPGRLARLIADFGDRGIAGRDRGDADGEAEPESAAARMLKPRERTVEWVGD